MSDGFEQLLERWLRERGRSDRESLAALADHVAALPPRRPRPRRPLLLAATFVVLVVALVAALPRFGRTVAEPSPSPTTLAGERSPATAALATYESDGFSFRYPAEWRIIGEYRHEGLPTVEIAIGIGGFDRECTTVPPPTGVQRSHVCAGPVWDVPDDGVVLAYYEQWILPEPTLSTRPGEHVASVGGRRASASTDATSAVWEWRLDPPWVIEVRFGPENRKINQAAVLDVIASWSWKPAEDATPVSAPTRPPWATDLAGALDCDGPIQDIGGEVGAIEPSFSTGTASPYPWLDLRDDVELPLSGWTEDPKTPWETGESNYVRYVNEVGDRIKAVIVMRGHSTDGGRGSWAVVAYRACPPNEFDPARGSTLADAPWRDVSGSVSRRARAIIGPPHCGWELSIFLHLDGRTYIRDPLGLFADRTAGPYLADTELSPDATSTGLTSAGRELFTSPNEDFVWIRAGDVVERWSRATEEFGCA